MKNNQNCLPGLVSVWRFAVYVTVIHALILIILKSGQVELILVLPMHSTGHWNLMHGSMHYRQLVHLSGLQAVDALSSLMDICSILPEPFRKSRILPKY